MKTKVKTTKSKNSKATANQAGAKSQSKQLRLQSDERIANLYKIANSPFNSVAQKEEAPEEEELMQGKFKTIQLEAAPEEEELMQGKFKTIQLEEVPEEEDLKQGKFKTSQLEEMPEEEEPIQGKFKTTQLQEGLEEEEPIQSKPNKTGMPDQLKAGIETLSGHAMDDVKVHYNSSKPNELNAHAYAQGTDIHLASGQEKHLPHEAWHVAQQKQGRVISTTNIEGTPLNDNPSLESEADKMGLKATQFKEKTKQATSTQTTHHKPEQTQQEIDNRGADESESLIVSNSVEKAKKNPSNITVLQHVRMNPGTDNTDKTCKRKIATALYDAFTAGDIDKADLPYIDVDVGGKSSKYESFYEIAREIIIQAKDSLDDIYGTNISSFHSNIERITDSITRNQFISRHLKPLIEIGKIKHQYREYINGKTVSGSTLSGASWSVKIIVDLSEGSIIDCLKRYNQIFSMLENPKIVRLLGKGRRGFKLSEGGGRKTCELSTGTDHRPRGTFEGKITNPTKIILNRTGTHG